MADYSHLGKGHLKGRTGVKKYKQRGNKKKGSLWQKTKSDEKKVPYISAGVEEHESGGGESGEAPSAAGFFFSHPLWLMRAGPLPPH